ncbi:hypothetical protein JCM11491_007077 [Sporobolomyces phaffii]
MSSGGKSKPQSEKKPGQGTTNARRAGLIFPPSRMRRFLKAGRFAARVNAGAPVYLAAVCEYLVAEILELGGNAALDNKKHRISPRHIQLAVRNDEELNRLLGNVTISQGGVLPGIQPELLPAFKAKQKKEVERRKAKKAGLPVSDDEGEGGQQSTEM